MKLKSAIKNGSPMICPVTSAAGLVCGYIFNKDSLICFWIMLCESLLCAVFGGMLFKGYKPKDSV